jgi:hypothetical protein
MKAELLVVCITKGKEINEQAHFQLYANEGRICLEFLFTYFSAACKATTFPPNNSENPQEQLCSFHFDEEMKRIRDLHGHERMRSWKAT